MAFKPGESGNKNGRPKGVPNKMNKLVKEYFQECFEVLQQDGDAQYSLNEWAKRNPSKFYLLAAKLIPVQVQAEGQVNHAHAHVSLEGLTLDELLKLKYGPDHKRQLEDFNRES